MAPSLPPLCHFFGSRSCSVSHFFCVVLFFWLKDTVPLQSIGKPQFISFQKTLLIWCENSFPQPCLFCWLNPQDFTPPHFYLFHIPLPLPHIPYGMLIILADSHGEPRLPIFQHFAQCFIVSGRLEWLIFPICLYLNIFSFVSHFESLEQTLKYLCIQHRLCWIFLPSVFCPSFKQLTSAKVTQEINKFSIMVKHFSCCIATF